MESPSRDLNRAQINRVKTLMTLCFERNKTQERTATKRTIEVKGLSHRIQELNLFN
jgi:hypothetical protein